MTELDRLRSEVQALRDRAEKAEAQRDSRAEQVETITAHRNEIAADRDRLAAANAALEAKVARLVGALRLIELIGYREGEDFGWINAHMRGVATAALSGDSIDHYWRLFPNHRRAALAEVQADARREGGE